MPQGFGVCVVNLMVWRRKEEVYSFKESWKKTEQIPYSRF